MAQPQREHSPGPSVASEDEHEEEFSSVLSVLKKENLAPLGSAVLQRTKPEYSTVVTDPSVGEPLYGSYHVLFPLTFNDELRWLVKIPINGTPEKWDDLSAASLSSEANTMRLLKRETTIPIPEVFDFSSSTQNLIGCPYILMEFISGIPLYDLWFTNRLNGTSSDLTRERRTRALEGVASAMSQLYKYSFNQEGMPVFGDSGEIERLGPMRMIDHQAMLEQCSSDQDADGNIIYVKVEASSDKLADYTFVSDQYPESDPTDRGLELILRKMISRVPDPEEKHPFVLTHPDFEIQNFIVSEDGELIGIIDWDGVCSALRSLGNENYPGWLTRDWDEALYAYKVSMEEEGAEPDGLWEDSPETLSYYRGIYNNLMNGNRAGMGRKPEPNLTRMSLITQKLAIACSSSMRRINILQKISQESWIAAGREDELNVMELAVSLVEDGTNSEVTEKLSTLMRGFDMLLGKSGL